MTQYWSAKGFAFRFIDHIHLFFYPNRYADFSPTLFHQHCASAIFPFTKLRQIGWTNASHCIPRLVKFIKNFVYSWRIKYDVKYFLSFSPSHHVTTRKPQICLRTVFLGTSNEPIKRQLPHWNADFPSRQIRWLFSFYIPTPHIPSYKSRFICHKKGWIYPPFHPFPSFKFKTDF